MDNKHEFNSILRRYESNKKLLKMLLDDFDLMLPCYLLLGERCPARELTEVQDTVEVLRIIENVAETYRGQRGIFRIFGWSEDISLRRLHWSVCGFDFQRSRCLKTLRLRLLLSLSLFNFSFFCLNNLKRIFPLCVNIV